MLSRRHTLVRYDLRGCGLSDRERLEFSFERLVEDFEAVVEAAKLDRTAILGMTSGGRIAVAYAVRHPDRVSHLVLYGVSPSGPLARNPSPEQVEETELRLRAIELGWPKELPGYGQFFASLHIPDATPEQSRAYNDLLGLTTSPANAVRLLRTFFQSDVHEIVSRVGCPTLVMHARDDAILAFDQGRALAAMIHGARFVPLESRNHILLDNEPAWDRCVKAIDDFLPGAQQSLGTTSLSLDDLTSREREVLEIVAQGLDNYAIAARLDISEKTVRNHVSVIFSKLGVTSRAQAVALARNAGIGRRDLV